MICLMKKDIQITDVNGTVLLELSVLTNKKRKDPRLPGEGKTVHCEKEQKT